MADTGSSGGFKLAIFAVLIVVLGYFCLEENDWLYLR
jgi:hypothetical protein